MSHWQQIALECGTDKGTHTYMPVYERFLGPLASDPINLLEIGTLNGNSLRMWLKLFPNGRIRSIDLAVCGDINDKRLVQYVGLQQDPLIGRFFASGTFDVIMDDGCHLREAQRDSVEILWPCLKVGGYYFIEDILTDDYPDEIDHWRADPHYLYHEANCHDIYGKYERADAIVVLQKRGDRLPKPLLSKKPYPWSR